MPEVLSCSDMTNARPHRQTCSTILCIKWRADAREVWEQVERGGEQTNKQTTVPKNKGIKSNLLQKKEKRVKMKEKKCRMYI